MKKLTLLSVIFTIIFFGCELNGNYVYPVGYNSSTWYVLNTLNYPIKVQSYFLALDAPGTGEWYEKQPAAWSPPVEIQPGDKVQIMDFMMPDIIRIYRASDNILLNEEFGNIALGKKEIPNEFNYPDEALFFRPSENTGFLTDAKYLVENFPWEIYPLGCGFGQPVPSLEIRKSHYIANGISRIRCIRLNPNHPSFK